jgi:sulfopyruvate decarboxylase subunit alpha
MLVGLLGKEPGVAPSQSKKYGVKIIEPVLDAMGIEHHWVEEAADTQKIVPAIEKAYADTRPMAVLIGREPK